MSAAATTPAPPTDRTLRAMAMFGLTVPARNETDRGARPARCTAWAALALEAVLAPGRLALIAGPSGSGKSTLLRTLAQSTPTRVVMMDGAARDDGRLRPSRTLVDQFDEALKPTLRLLARPGLSEAPLLASTPMQLSDGQRFRLRLALAMAEAERAARRPPRSHVTLLVDEFGATLDRVTAAGVAVAMRRWTDARTRIRVALASSHDDLLESLRPDALAIASLDGTVTVHRR